MREEPQWELPPSEVRACQGGISVRHSTSHGVWSWWSIVLIRNSSLVPLGQQTVLSVGAPVSQAADPAPGRQGLLPTGPNNVLGEARPKGAP